MSEQLEDPDDQSPPPEHREPGPPDEHCNAKVVDDATGEVRACNNPAGFRTWHGPSSEGGARGRCGFHGGGPPNREDDGRIRHGLNSQISHTETGAEIAETLERDETPVHGMKRLAAVMEHVASRAVAEHIIGQDEVEPERYERIQKILDKANLALTRAQKAESRDAVPRDRVSVIVQKITRIVRDKISDPQKIEEIGRELQGEVIEAEIVED